MSVLGDAIKLRTWSMAIEVETDPTFRDYVLHLAQQPPRLPGVLPVRIRSRVGRAR